MKKIIIPMTTMLFLCGCANVPIMKEDIQDKNKAKLSPEQEIYIEKVKKTPLEIEISKSEERDAWGRAQSFIAKYCRMKLQIVTDFVLQTYTPTGYDCYFAYYITKTPLKETFQITVKCFAPNPFSPGPKGSLDEDFKRMSDRNAHILIYYIMTGELPYPELICIDAILNMKKP